MTRFLQKRIPLRFKFYGYHLQFANYEHRSITQYQYNISCLL